MTFDFLLFRFHSCDFPMVGLQLDPTGTWSLSVVTFNLRRVLNLCRCRPLPAVRAVRKRPFNHRPSGTGAIRFTLDLL